MGSKIEVEFFEPDMFPYADPEHRGGWSLLYGREDPLHAIAIMIAQNRDHPDRVVRMTWRP